MVLTNFDERKLTDSFRKGNHEEFHQYIAAYDKEVAPSLRARGYKCVNKSERTVLFIFGEVTFKRNRWYKDGKCYVPVDEKLGLRKNERYSQELLFQITELASMMPYRAVVRVVEMMYNISITPNTVCKAISYAGDLLEERKDYRFYEESQAKEKILTDRLYIEGDGVMLRFKEPKKEDSGIFKELSHFVVHTGSEKVGHNRFQLQNKKEIVADNNLAARKELEDYLHNHFDLTDDAIVITNSDGGRGYTPYIFKELVKFFGKEVRHEHFYDEYHLNKDLTDSLRSYPEELLDKAFGDIQTHDKEMLRTVYDTAESLTDSEAALEKLLAIRDKLLNNFQYTKPAELRGFSHAGIGIMESQHRKITYRMKHRGMYWSEAGGDTMSQIILLRQSGELRELFFGSWREDYKQYQELEKNFASAYLKETHEEHIGVQKVKCPPEFSHLK
ncbi:ISLre2 family transposase [Streptococcus suis]|uniref:ISLre2 family transposase n=1 Tax=Streptococcus suis TaxID=1307 RepID=UPI000419737C|nr:ISLre2 family transposase [Streptococcus suis]HEM3179828.1 ISLre2 family transposase [Streptococcus suis 92-4172]